MALKDDYDLSADGTFQNRVGAAMRKQALVVVAESSGITGHTLRASLAVNCLGPQGHIFYPAFARAITAGNASLGVVYAAASGDKQNAIADADITTGVVAAWNPIAGVTT